MVRWHHFDIREYQDECREDCVCIKQRVTGKILYDGSSRYLERILIFAAIKGIEDQEYKRC